MAGKGVWIVTWLPLTARVIGAWPMMPRREERKFKEAKDAVSFVMGLDESLRTTAEIVLPCGDIVGLPVIEQMHAAGSGCDDRKTY
jgi:hypothetical protein